MDKNDKKPETNKPVRDDDNIKTNNLPYDPNVNDDDMLALHEDGLNMAPDEDKQLENRDKPVDFTGKDLDIPPREERDTTSGTEIPDPDNYQWNERGAKPGATKGKDHPHPKK